jgi:ubiquinone/menaquinone biosynthesis C-methylase UbiE
MTAQPTYTDRRRAESFGAIADAYDRYRPRYPQALIDGLVTHHGIRVLDVGAGTGIASAQLAEAGAQVTAVEPDERMARVAAAKGIHVEQATFEHWEQAGRSFDLVVFASSFHWVQPGPALKRIATMLRTGGRLVLLGNEIIPIAPTRQVLDQIYGDYVDVGDQSAAKGKEVGALLDKHGYRVDRRHVVQPVHYSRDDYLGLTFTYSNRLVLDPASRADLRSRLAGLIGAAGVDAESNATAFVCERPADH